MKKGLAILTISVFMFLLITGCAKDEEKNTCPVFTSDIKITVGTTLILPGDSVEVGSRISLEVTASDKDNDVIQYSWTVNGQQFANEASTIYRLSKTPGSYTFTVTITDGNKDCQGISTSRTIEAVEIPKLVVSKTELDFASEYNELTFDVSNTGTGTLTFNITSDANWITVTPNSGSITADEKSTIKVSINRALLSPGINTGKITVDGGKGGKAEVVVKANYEPPPEGDVYHEDFCDYTSIDDFDWYLVNENLEYEFRNCIMCVKSIGDTEFLYGTFDTFPAPQTGSFFMTTSYKIEDVDMLPEGQETMFYVATTETLFFELTDGSTFYGFYIGFSILNSGNVLAVAIGTTEEEPEQLYARRLTNEKRANDIYNHYKRGNTDWVKINIEYDENEDELLMSVGNQNVFRSSVDFRGISGFADEFTEDGELTIFGFAFFIAYFDTWVCFNSIDVFSEKPSGAKYSPVNRYNRNIIDLLRLLPDKIKYDKPINLYPR